MAKQGKPEERGDGLENRCARDKRDKEEHRISGKGGKKVAVYFPADVMQNRSALGRMRQVAKGSMVGREGRTTGIEEIVKSTDLRLEATAMTELRWPGRSGL